MKKVLITGASGFIGHNLKEQLCNDYQIAAPSSKELNLLDSESVYSFLRDNKFDIVLHCATHNATKNSQKDLSHVFYSNLRMFFNLARCNQLYGRMFYFGSGAEYDKAHYIPKMNEDYFGNFVPVDDYGFSKYISAEYVTKVSNIYNLRIFGCFGKYEDWEIRFISNACCKALFDVDITLRQNVCFDYLYVDDLVSILKWFIERDTLRYQYYNVCTGSSIDLLSIAKIVKDISQKDVSIRIEATGFGPEYSGDNTRLLTEMNHFTFTPMKESVSKLYEWYGKNRHLIKKDLLLVDK